MHGCVLVGLRFCESWHRTWYANKQSETPQNIANVLVSCDEWIGMWFQWYNRPDVTFIYCCWVGWKQTKMDFGADTTSHLAILGDQLTVTCRYLLRLITHNLRTTVASAKEPGMAVYDLVSQLARSDSPLQPHYVYSVWCKVKRGRADSVPDVRDWTISIVFGEGALCYPCKTGFEFPVTALSRHAVKEVHGFSLRRRL